MSIENNKRYREESSDPQEQEEKERILKRLKEDFEGAVRFQDSFLTTKHLFERHMAELQIKDFIGEVLQRKRFIAGVVSISDMIEDSNQKKWLCDFLTFVGSKKSDSLYKILSQNPPPKWKEISEAYAFFKPKVTQKKKKAEPKKKMTKKLRQSTILRTMIMRFKKENTALFLDTWHKFKQGHQHLSFPRTEVQAVLEEFYK